MKHLWQSWLKRTGRDTGSWDGHSNRPHTVYMHVPRMTLQLLPVALIQCLWWLFSDLWKGLKGCWEGKKNDREICSLFVFIYLLDFLFRLTCFAHPDISKNMKMPLLTFDFHLMLPMWKGFTTSLGHASEALIVILFVEQLLFVLTFSMTHHERISIK